MQSNFPPASKIRMTQIGLPERDLTFIGNLFRLGAVQLKNYQYSDHYDRDAHVILLNGDSQAILNRWKRLRKENPDLLGIVISATGVKAEGAIHLTRPLVLKKFVNILQEAALAVPGVVENSVHVLVVDDNSSIRHYLALKLPELFEYSVTIDTAETSVEALNKMQSRDYDVVFLDADLSGINANQVCKQMKSIQNPHIILLNDNQSPFQRFKSSMSACDSIVSKPATDERLLPVIQKFTNRFKKVS